MSFGPRAVRAYLDYCGVPVREADRLAASGGSEPLDELGGASVNDLTRGLDAFFAQHHMGSEWDTGEVPPLPRAPSGNAPAHSPASNAEFPLVIGLTGERECGKSVIGDHLVNDLGFVRLHPFGPGKALLRGYYEARGADAQTAWHMTDGDLKNAPSPFLPLNPETGQHFSSRWVMERLGRFMGQDMGLSWTIGAEMRHHARESSGAGLLIESVVYEADEVHAMGGVIIRLSLHPDVPARGTAPIGEVSDSFVNAIAHDGEVLNRMSGKPELIADFSKELARVLEARAGLSAGMEI